jgi:hypothetical protein
MNQLDLTLQPRPARRFNGPAYDPVRDNERLGNQFDAIFALMKDGVYRTLPAIEEATGYPQASISAQLRHARKKRFGSHTVNRRHIKNGLFEYQLVVNAV